MDDGDRCRFLRLLAESLETYQVVLHTYIMMSNHFHLVVQTMRANLSEFMRRFNICYTGWFNYHHDRCGHLYQGRYKALLVDPDNYLLGVSRYVHLNPLPVSKFRKSNYREQWRHVRGYPWSSLPGYVNHEKVVDFVHYEMVLDMVGGRRAYQRFLLDGLREGMDDPLEGVQYQVILGDDDFVARVKSERIGEGSLREQPMYRDMVADVVDPEQVLDGVAKALDIHSERLRVRMGNGVVRGIAAELLYRYSDITQREIGELLGGIDYTAVSMLRHRLKLKIVHDRKVRAEYARAERCLRTICEE